MLREMSSQQVDEWIAFYRLEPWGLAVLDNLFAHFKALFVRANMPKGKTPPKPEKLLLWPEQIKRTDAVLEPQDDEEEWQQQA